MSIVDINKHQDYIQMLKTDLHYVDKQIELWEDKVRAAQVELDKWEKQRNYLNAVRCRCDLNGLSPYAQQYEEPDAIPD